MPSGCCGASRSRSLAPRTSRRSFPRCPADRRGAAPGVRRASSATCQAKPCSRPRDRLGRRASDQAAAGVAGGHWRAVGAAQAAGPLARRYGMGPPSASDRGTHAARSVAASSCSCPCSSEHSGDLRSAFWCWVPAVRKNRTTTTISICWPPSRSASGCCSSGRLAIGTRTGRVRQLWTLLRLGDKAVLVRSDQPLTTARGSRLLNGRYRLERRLGRGGMGTVYAAVDDVLERTVAVKLIREDIGGSARSRAPVSGRKRVRPPALPTLTSSASTISVSIAIDGRSWSWNCSRAKRCGSVSHPAAARAPRSSKSCAGSAAALTAAHGQGLVHRDLKPENIFLQRHASGVVAKVLDFGLAKAFAADWPTAQAHRHSDQRRPADRHARLHGAGTGRWRCRESRMGRVGPQRDRVRDAHGTILSGARSRLPADDTDAAPWRYRERPGVRTCRRPPPPSSSGALDRPRAPPG